MPVRLLIADDNRDFVTCLCGILKVRQGIEVVGTATDGAETLRLIRRQLPDVLLMDVVMPGLDGIEVLRRLSEGAYFHKPAVFVVSALENEEVNSRVRSLGALCCFTKPLDIDEMVARIRQVPTGENHHTHQIIRDSLHLGIRSIRPLGFK